MRKLLGLLALTSVSVSVSVNADHLTTTYVCGSPTGVKTVQDFPCESGTPAKTVDTIKHDRTIDDTFASIAERSRSQSRKIHCDFLRSSMRSQADANRTELSKFAGNQQRQNLNRDRADLAENCLPYGR